jgi:hypothetical protein
MLEASRAEYNRAITRSNEEQLLLNLVRLRYRESPLFLDVGAVSAQFKLEQTADLSGRYSSDQSADASLLGLGSRLAYEERPTITYTPLQGDAYASRLMSPLTFDTVMLLFYSGWRIDRILRLTVQRINNVENAVRAAGPTPRDVPKYKDFAELTDALKQLQWAGQLDLGYETREEEVLGSLPAEQVTVADVIAADEKTYQLRKIPEQNAYALVKVTNVPVIRIARTKVVAGESGRDFARILGIAPGLGQYDMKEAFSARGEGEDFRYDELALGMRSLMGVLFYLSQGVAVPSSHVERGLVTVTRDDAGNVFDWSEVTGDLLKIQSATERPANAATAVRYRDHWFYIAEDDLDSRTTMVLLLQLFALQAGGADVQAPVLTLPLGN